MDTNEIRVVRIFDSTGQTVFLSRTLSDSLFRHLVGFDVIGDTSGSRSEKTGPKKMVLYALEEDNNHVAHRMILTLESEVGMEPIPHGAEMAGRRIRLDSIPAEIRKKYFSGRYAPDSLHLPLMLKQVYRQRFPIVLGTGRRSTEVILESLTGVEQLYTITGSCDECSDYGISQPRTTWSEASPAARPKVYLEITDMRRFSEKASTGRVELRVDLMMKGADPIWEEYVRYSELDFVIEMEE